MANNIGGRPWVIDTASADIIKTGNVYVKGFAFSNYAAATDQCIITGSDGNGAGASRITVLVLEGNSALSSVDVNLAMPIWVRDIAVTTLTSGQLSVFI